MAKFRIVLHTSNKRKDGSNPVCLRITKRGKLKYIDLKLSAFENEWDTNADRFKRDKRVNPNYESYNNWLISCEERKNEVVNKFMKAQVDWTLNQFEEAIDLLSGLTPLEMTFQLISQNMFYGMLMAIPTALIVMRKKKNE